MLKKEKLRTELEIIYLREHFRNIVSSLNILLWQKIKCFE